MNKFRYNDKTERYQKVNRFFLLAVYLLFAILMFYLVASMMREGTSTIYMVNTVIVVVLCLVDTIIFAKDKASEKYKIIIAVEVWLVFILFCVTTPATFLGFALMGVLGVAIPYYDDKFFRIAIVGSTVLYTLSLIYREMTGISVLGVDSLGQIMMTYAVFLMLARVGAVSKQFSDDALGAVEEQSALQKQMMQEILKITQTVKEESDSSTEMMNQLLDSTMQTAKSMEQISSATEVTAENIGMQTEMTKDIQEAITTTKELSGQMVSIAEDSNRNIKENLQKKVEELKLQSEQIAGTNRQVTEAMGRLQTKTAEVEEIAAIILNISGQTNLLALNASIESARAGEAGKGFAVVADQIRQLAEETRKSTESIKGIIDELNTNSKEVVDIIRISVEAADGQNEMIALAAGAFDDLNRNITDLIVNVKEIDHRIEDLSESNDRIVKNISEISATTQEVTASAEQASNLGEKNVEYAQNTKSALSNIQESASGLKKYF